LLACSDLSTSPPTPIYTLSLHDALPISPDRETVGRTGAQQPRVVPSIAGELRRSRSVHDAKGHVGRVPRPGLQLHRARDEVEVRSEEHTSELQSRVDLVCRLLLEKKNTL